MVDLRREMGAALASTVVPALRATGFKGALRHFGRRREGTPIDLLTFQFDKRGGRFVIELARCAPNGVTTPWGQHIGASKVTVHDLHPTKRHRLSTARRTGDRLLVLLPGRGLRSLREGSSHGVIGGGGMVGSARLTLVEAGLDRW